MEFTCLPPSASGSEVSIVWRKIPLDKQNGIIRNYTLTLHPFNMSEEAIEMTVPVNLTSLTITNLTSMTPYTVTIQAVTIAPGPPTTITCLTGIYKSRLDRSVDLRIQKIIVFRYMMSHNIIP